MGVARKSAGIVVVNQVADGYRFLLLRAYRNWDFPKGSIESGEEPLQAAIRETREETGLADLQFRWGYDFTETAPYAQGKIARYYLAAPGASGSDAAEAVHLGVNPALGRPEHHEFRWVGPDDALLLAPPRLTPVIEWARRALRGQSEPAQKRS